MLTATEPQQLGGSLTQWVSDLLRWDGSDIRYSDRASSVQLHVFFL